MNSKNNPGAKHAIPGIITKKYSVLFFFLLFKKRNNKNKYGKIGTIKKVSGSCTTWNR